MEFIIRFGSRPFDFPSLASHPGGFSCKLLKFSMRGNTAVFFGDTICIPCKKINPVLRLLHNVVPANDSCLLLAGQHGKHKPESFSTTSKSGDYSGVFWAELHVQ